MFIIGIIANTMQSKKIKKEIQQENLNAEIVFINSKSMQNIKNVKFEIVVIQNLLEKIRENKKVLKEIFKNSKYLLLNTDLVIEEDLFEETSAKIITYGLKQKSTITASSMEDSQVIISIQRAFENLQGNVIEVQEIPSKIDKEGANYIDNLLIKTAIININDAKNA